jgi:hypothetical protein
MSAGPSALVVAWTAFAATMIIRGILANNRNLAEYEQPAVDAPVQEDLPR